MMLSDAVLRSAMASKLAYAKSTNMVATFPVSRQLLPEKSVFEVMDCSYTGAHAYVWRTGPKSTVIAFRGSHNIIDICSYINARSIPFSFCDRNMEVHQIIYMMFASIEPWIASHMSPRSHVTFCGHSLGGAIAMFAAAYFAHISNRNINVTCHTFGTPKVGDVRFVDWFTEYVPDHVNVRNKWDIVTYYPFDRKFASSSSVLLSKPPTNPFRDHDLDMYIENIVNDMSDKGYKKTHIKCSR